MSIALLTWTSQLAIQYVSFVVIVVESQSCPTLWNPMDWSTPGFSVLHHHPEFDQSHIHWARDAMLILSWPYFSRLQSFWASGSFPMSHIFSSGGQSIGVSASVPVLPMNIQGWFSLGLTDLTFLLPKGLSRTLTTVQRHQFFGAQTFILSSSHIHTWLLEKP